MIHNVDKYETRDMCIGWNDGLMFKRLWVQVLLIQNLVFNAFMT